MNNHNELDTGAVDLHTEITPNRLIKLLADELKEILTRHPDNDYVKADVLADDAGVPRSTMRGWLARRGVNGLSKACSTPENGRGLLISRRRFREWLDSYLEEK